MKAHMVTGGTGFIGAALILELLQQTDDEIFCLIRPDEEDIDTRLYRTLQQAVQLYRHDKYLLVRAQKRCSPVAGDLTMYLCGCTPGDVQGKIEHFWHCGASLKFEDYHSEETYRTNVDGTRSALTLAKRLNVQVFHYVSTAYVAGKLTGLLREELFSGHETNNPYEASKNQAEHLVAAATEFRTQIFRPSAVVGHSRTYAIQGNLTGMYKLSQRFLQMRALMERLQLSYMLTEAPHIYLDPEVPVNMIPVDILVQQMVKIAFSASPARIFHMTNSTPPKALDILTSAFQILEAKEPIYVTSKDEFTELDHQLDQAMFFQSMFTERKYFDRSNSNQALGDEKAGDFPVEVETIENYIRWSLPLLKSSLKVSAGS